jgi:hypothetical protein
MARRFHNERYPEFSYKRWAGQPSKSFKQMWRKQARVRQKQVMQSCKDFSELQIETKITKLTSLYDWY